MNPGLLKLIYKPTVKRAVHHSLRGQNRNQHLPGIGGFTRGGINGLLDEVWCRFDRLASEAPSDPTAGNRVNMMIACLTLSLFEVMLAAGVERRYAIGLSSDVAHRMCKRAGTLPFLIARALTRDRAKRLRTAASMFRAYPFNTPGYIYERVTTADGVFFAIFRCPLADYFRAHNASLLMEVLPELTPLLAGGLDSRCQTQ
jgi:hypothetical protein